MSRPGLREPRIPLAVLVAVVHGVGCGSAPPRELPPPPQRSLLPDRPANPVFSPLTAESSAAAFAAVPDGGLEGSAGLTSIAVTAGAGPHRDGAFAEELAADRRGTPERLTSESGDVSAVRSGEIGVPNAGPGALGDAVEQSFRDDLEDLQAVLEEIQRGQKLDDFERLRKVELEKRLIAHFFLKKDRALEAYRSLVDSLSEESPAVSLEILKAAFFEELGMTEHRDRALGRLPRTELGPTPAGSFAISRCFFVRHYGGRHGDVVPLAAPVVFRPGQDVQLYGELSGFRSVVVDGRYRRSFTACLSIRDAAGELVGRRTPFLVAGQAREEVSDPNAPVHFHGRYRVPASLEPGSYRLEVVALDLEGGSITKAELRFEVK